MKDIAQKATFSLKHNSICASVPAKVSVCRQHCARFTKVSFVSSSCHFRNRYYLEGKKVVV